MIDGLGSIIKAISGNLDNNDLVNIENKFSLTTDVLEGLNKKISNLSSHINDLTHEYLQNNIKNSVTSELLFSYQSLTDICNNLNEAYVFAQHDILHPSIIDQVHLTDSINRIPKEINILRNVLKLEAQIKPHVTLQSNIMIFQLPIPIISRNTYNLEQILPIINKNKTHCTIPNLVPGQYLVRDDQVYEATDCKQSICNTRLPKECVRNSILRQQNTCEELLIFCPTVYSRKIKDNLYYRWNLEETTINDKCNSRKMVLLGSYIEDNTDCFAREEKTAIKIYQGLYTEPINDYPIAMTTNEDDATKQIETLRRHQIITTQASQNSIGLYVLCSVISVFIITCVIRQSRRMYSRLGGSCKYHDSTCIPQDDDTAPQNEDKDTLSPSKRVILLS